MILIQNGRVLDPVTNTDQVMDVLLDESGIVKTGEHLEAEGADVIDASGLVVAPGLMDAHVHFRDPGLTYKEDIFTGAAAAARGGFTTVVCMANTNPTVDNVETLDLVQKKGGISQWREYEFTEELIERGLSNVVERIKLIEPPVITTPVSTCDKLVELWKWNEFGDVIRNMTRGISCAG